MQAVIAKYVQNDDDTDEQWAIANLIPSASRRRNGLGPGPGIESRFKGPQCIHRGEHKYQAENHTDSRVEMREGTHESSSEE